jgi:hypothetical protein
MVLAAAMATGDLGRRILPNLEVICGPPMTDE